MTMHSSVKLSKSNRVLGWCWLLFCLTPYVGIQYQHTAAMLSNLRIDQGCHNSLLFSASLVEEDSYIRIDRARFGAEDWAKREQVLETGLWNEAALFTMKRKWCKEWVRPIALTVQYRGVETRIDDLCEMHSLSFLPTRFHLFPRFQRFQKNLTRNCTQACIH